MPQSEMILYQTEDGRTRVQCRFEEESMWLTQAQIAELFQTTPQNVTLHLKAIFAEGELAETATCKDYLQVRREGKREVSRQLRHYRLGAILACGFRVRRGRKNGRLTEAVGVSPLQGCECFMIGNPGRCPGLLHDAPLGRKNGNMMAN